MRHFIKKFFCEWVDWISFLKYHWKSEISIQASLRNPCWASLWTTTKSTKKQPRNSVANARISPSKSWKDCIHDWRKIARKDWRKHLWSTKWRETCLSSIPDVWVGAWWLYGQTEECVGEAISVGGQYQKSKAWRLWREFALIWRFFSKRSRQKYIPRWIQTVERMNELTTVSKTYRIIVV